MHVAQLVHLLKGDSYRAQRHRALASICVVEGWDCQKPALIIQWWTLLCTICIISWSVANAGLCFGNAARCVFRAPLVNFRHRTGDRLSLRIRRDYPVNPLSLRCMTEANDLLDIGEAARFLSVSETSLRRWTNAGALPCLRVGHRRERRFRRADLLAFMEDQPSHPTHGEAYPTAASTPPVLDGSILTHGDHLSGFYASDLGLITLSVRFILDGLEEGSMVYVAASARSNKRIASFLREKRPSLPRDIADRRLLFCEYQKGPRAQIKDFEVHLNKGVAAGLQSFRVLGETWEMRRKVSAGKFADYEATYDQIIAQRYPVVTLCAYDARRFSGVGVLDALKAHRDTFRYPLERALA